MPEQTIEQMPHIGHDLLVKQIIDRFQRPDDAQKSPKEFIGPGFHGLGGLGKSRLLRAVAEQVEQRKLTPYLLQLDFDKKEAITQPHQFIDWLIDTLATVDQQQRNRFNMWDRASRFQVCRDALKNEKLIISLNQIAIDGEIHNSPATVQTGEGEIPSFHQFCSEFKKAVAQLRCKSKPANRYDANPNKPCPRLLLLIDTLEAAPPAMQRWLAQHLDNLIGNSGLVVCAGRDPIDKLTPTALPALTAAQAVAFLRAYAGISQRLRFVELDKAGERQSLSPEPYNRLREDNALQAQIIQAAEGLPLLLKGLAELALTDFAGFVQTHQQAQTLPTSQRIQYVFQRYIERLRQQAEATNDELLWQRYELICAGAIPRRLVSNGLCQCG